MRKYLLPVAATLMVCSCTTMSNSPTSSQPAYLPANVIGQAPKPVDIPPDPLANYSPDMRHAIETNQTIKDGINYTFPYNSHGDITVNCEVMHITELDFNNDEKVPEDGLAAGDTERWAMQVVGNRVMVKPKAPGITTNLVVATDKRSYHYILRTHLPLMQQVSFYYPDEIKAQQIARNAALHATQTETPQLPLYANYTIKGPNVGWKPLRALDDTQHTYIEFPTDTHGADMPTLMAEDNGQSSVVNYQVRDSYYIVDRVLDHIVLSSGTGTNRRVVEIVRQ